MSSRIDELLAVHDLVQSGKSYVRLRGFNAKYPDEARQILVENQIWFSDILAQDDRFEGRPRFVWSSIPPTFEQVKELTRKHSGLRRAGEIDDAARRAHSRSMDPIALAWMQVDIENNLQRLYSGSSILSFFRNPMVQRYWAQYASNGSGYGLVFDFSVPWVLTSFQGEREGPAVPFRVTYVDRLSRPELRLSIAPSTPSEAFNDIQSALLTKSEDWSEQNEYRLVRVGIPAGMVTFPSKSLRALILGYEISEQDRLRLLEHVAERSEPLEVWRTIVSTKHYGLSMERIS